MSVRENTLNVLNELATNAKKIPDNQCNDFIAQICQANHIFLAGAGRSGIAIQAFANRLMHLGFSVSIVGEVSSPHSRKGDLVIICSGSGETSSLVNLSKKAESNNVDIALITMKSKSSIGNVSNNVIELPGSVKTDNKRDENKFSQPMGSAFEQLAFIFFDGVVLELMKNLDETSEKMFERHADFE